LGSRRYESQVPCFRVGSHLRVAVKKVLEEENGLGALECQIYIDGSLEAQVRATLTVFQVEDLEDFLKKSVL